MTRKKVRLEDVWGMIKTKEQTGRFREILSLRSIEDTETGKRYRGMLDDEFIELINDLDKECKKWQKEYFDTWFSEFYGGDEKEYNAEYERVFGKKP